jgi:hypothetical protein
MPSFVHNDLARRDLTTSQQTATTRNVDHFRGRLFDSREQRPEARMRAEHIVGGKDGYGGDVRFAFEECCLKRFDCAVVLAEAFAPSEAKGRDSTRRDGNYRQILPDARVGHGE